jgi:hypothetical protein
MEDVMGFSWKTTVRAGAALSGVAWLALAVAPPAFGQLMRRCNPPPDCAMPYSPPATSEPPANQQPTQPPTQPNNTQPAASETPPDVGGFRPPAGPGEMVSTKMIGNQLGITTLALVSCPCGNMGAASMQTATALVPSVRSFRISENESPRPEDRVYFGFNFFDNINAGVNPNPCNPIPDFRVYREALGLEKTFLDGNASIGLYMPLNTLTASTDVAGLNGTDTDVGDLSIIFKYVLCQDRNTGNLLSGGLAITAPTGPRGFAGSNLETFHNTVVQPYVGYIWNSGNLFIHGFEAIDVPTDGNDVTFLFTDIGIGYHLLPCRRDRFITDIVPTFEVHLSDALNHRCALNPADLAGSADYLDFTSGATFVFKHNCTLALAVVTPMTGPRPFDYEFVAQLNFNFGPRGAGTGPSPFNLLGN